MLKIKFWRIENVVLMKILEQDENLRKKTDWRDSETGIRIKSINSPVLSYYTIYIRGKMYEDDNLISSYSYETEKEAIKALKDIAIAIKNFNIHNTKGDSEPEIEQYIFE